MNGQRSDAAAYVVLTVGVVACATSVIFLKASYTHPIWLVGARLLIAAAALSLFYLWEWQRHRPSPRAILRAWPGAMMLALHFVTWTLGARMTDATNASLIVNLTPAVMPLVMFAMARERVNRGEVVGTLVSLAGVGVLIGSHYSLAAGNVAGDLVCFGSMALFCVYLGLSRLRAGPSLWLYVVPLYAIAGVLCLATAVGTRTPFPVLDRKEVLLLLALGLVPTVVGHSVLNWCIGRLRGQVVSTANLGQFIVAGVIAYFQFGESPDRVFYPASVLIVIGAAVVIRSNRTSVDVDAES